MYSRENTSSIETMRHSFAHVLAHAATRVFPGTKLGIGPAIEDGFYHDFQFPQPIGSDDLAKIATEMKRIINQDLPFQQILVPKDQAFDILNLQGQIFKTEILSLIPEDEVSFYKSGNDFMDLCRGPHVEHTGKLGAFSLTGISGVHWNGDESRPKMQRIHGIAFGTEEELGNYIQTQEQKREKDHRILAQKLDLYTLDQENGSGLPLWLPKGMSIRKIISDYIYRENMKLGYHYVSTPGLARNEVFEKSGDIDASTNTIFPAIECENDKFALRPRSTINHVQIYNSKKRSYRDLPFKLSEFATIFRNEKSGELSGLSKVRTFTSESNMIVCSKEQIKDVFVESIASTIKLYRDFGLTNYRVELALKGPNEQLYEGNPKDWLRLQNKIVDATKALGMTIYETPNTAERVGPGINFKFNDVYNKSWQLGSIFFDMRLPAVFKMKYVNSSNAIQSPFLIYRTAIGSFERFFALLIEHYGGSFPLWLSPVQVVIIPISEKFNEYAQRVHNTMVDNDINVMIDKDTETMQSKIRSAQLEMIPYMIVIGDKEKSTETISVRPRSGQDLGMMKIEEFIEKIKKEIEEKVIF